MDNLKKIKLGVFVFVTLALIVIAVFLIGQQQKMFSSTFYLSGYFKNVGGLQVGNNVRFSGINVGVIENIELVTDSLVKVDMQIEEYARKFIKTDAIANIGSEGLMGDKIVIISPGKKASQPIADGGKIKTTEPLDMDHVINEVSQIAMNASSITSDLAKMTNQINSGRGSLGRLIYDDDIAEDLKGTAANVKRGTKEFEENMNALQSNFLFKGYFKKKEKQEAEAKKRRQAKADSAKNSKSNKK